MKSHINQIRQFAQQATQGQAQTRVGLVSGYDPNTYSAKVAIQPEGVETGWLPITSIWVGNQWGLFCPPTIGEMVEVEFQGDSFESGMIVGRFFYDSARPLNVPSGEFWLVHEKGALFKLLNDGSATFSDGHGATVTLNGDGSITSQANTWNHTGPVNVIGDVSVTGAVQATGNISSGASVSDSKSSMQSLRDTYNGHKHTIPEPPPIEQM